MSFAPKSSGGNRKDENGTPRVYPTPKAGNRPARISLIVDLGTQEREDFENPDGTTKPQKPAHQIAIFADLVNDVVDYGGEVGKQPFRLMLNKSFKGVMEGVNFNTVPPRDADGNMIQGKDWGYHPMSLITKLAKATGVKNILDASDLDIMQLLNKPLMIDIDIKETESDKKDEAGNKIIYKNLKINGYSSVPMDEDEDGNEVPRKLKECSVAPMLITFDNVTPETAKYLRADVKRKIQTALNYEGSQMQKVLGAAQAETQQEAPEAKEEAKPAKDTGKGRKSAPKASQEVVEDFDDSDIPFN